MIEITKSKTAGCDLIVAERLRQIKKEKWNANHDDEHRRMEMSRAAAAYLLNVWERSKLQEGVAERYVLSAAVNVLWPWEDMWWKPADDPVRTLVKAGALIAAEIDRLNRLHIENGIQHPKEKQPALNLTSSP